MDFTALGDAVNTTARLQAEAGAGELVLSTDLVRQCGRALSAAPAPRPVSIRGRDEPVEIIVMHPATDTFLTG
jgi:adenylate cyclase